MYKDYDYHQDALRAAEEAAKIQEWAKKEADGAIRMAAIKAKREKAKSLKRNPEDARRVCPLSR